jgi:hypothetical protein
MFVLVLQVVLDIEFGVFLQRSGPMEVAHSLMSIDGNLWISELVNNPHDIPIGLCVVRHKAFEVGFGYSMAGHHMIMLEKNLDWKSHQSMVMTRW